MSEETEAERILRMATEENEFTDFLRTYTTDKDGNRVMVGLTKKETEEHRALKRKWLQGHLSDSADPYASVEERSAAGDRMIELDNKHERARRQVLGAEVELRTDKPTIN